MHVVSSIGFYSNQNISNTITSFSNDKDVLERFANVQPPLQNNAVITAMNAELIKTYGELSNLTRTTIDQSQKDLLNMLNEVDYRVASGIQSYNSAVREVLDQYAGNERHEDFTPDEDALIDFVNKVMPVMNELFSMRNEEIHKKYSPNRAARRRNRNKHNKSKNQLMQEYKDAKNE